MFVADLAAPELEPADAHHLAQVLRLDDGDPVVAADGTGAFCPCRIEIARSTPAGAPRSRRPAPVRLQRDGAIAETAAPDPPLGVGFALHKGERPEWAVQKLTELGIDRIITFTTERTVVRLDRGGGTPTWRSPAPRGPGGGRAVPAPDTAPRRRPRGVRGGAHPISGPGSPSPSRGRRRSPRR